MKKGNYVYAVRKGRKEGVFGSVFSVNDNEDLMNQIDGFDGAYIKVFPTSKVNEAHAWVKSSKEILSKRIETESDIAEMIVEDSSYNEEEDNSEEESTVVLPITENSIACICYDYNFYPIDDNPRKGDLMGFSILYYYNDKVLEEEGERIITDRVIKLGHESKFELNIIEDSLSKVIPGKKVIIFTKNDYIFNVFNYNLKTWEKNDFRVKDGSRYVDNQGTLKNLSLIIRNNKLKVSSRKNTFYQLTVINEYKKSIQM